MKGVRLLENCIFCKIIKGEIPSAKVYEDEHVLAFLDLSQATKGHTLVIPKKHVENVLELDEETAAHIFSVVPKIARSLTSTLHAKGLNIANNNKEVAGQTVFHVHIHLVPRYSEDDGFQVFFTNHMDEYSSEVLQQIAESVRINIK